MELDKLTEDYIQSLTNESLERLDAQLEDLEISLRHITVDRYKGTERATAAERILSSVEARRCRCATTRTRRGIHGDEGTVAYPAPPAFENTTIDERSVMSGGNGIHILTAQRGTLGNGAWRREAFAEPTEIAPPSGANEAAEKARILALLGGEPKDAFLWFGVKVYGNEGHRFYKCVDEDNFTIYVIFPTGTEA